MRDKPKKERSIAFIVARLSSSRLPAKHLRPIGDRPMLQWVVNQLQNSKELDEVVLATVDEPENWPLKNFAEENGIACFGYTGEVDHVTTRLCRAAEAFNADICILVSGDCPLIFAPAIDKIIRSIKNNTDADTVRLPADAYGQTPALQGIVVGRKKAWQLADDLADRPELKEHQFPVIGIRPELFQPVDVMLPDSLYHPHHRLSVDTLADLSFMNAIYDALDKRNLPFQLPDVVALLKERPDLKEINAHVHQRRLVENIKKVLFVVDAGGSYGFGHLTRCVELAQQITERLGWPTHFLVDDHQTKAIIQKTGCKTHWGAFGRAASQNYDQPSSTIETLISDYDLLIVDIFDQRGPKIGWRSNFNKEVSCVVIENTQKWADEADMIVLPNILDKHSAGFTSDNFFPESDMEKNMKPRLVGGESYIILRKEIRQLISHLPKKEIDVLIYLHDDKRSASLKKRLISMGLKTKLIQSFSSEFANDLATTRVFISGFGVSFNEALALETLPVCWPDSDSHRDDAARFYRNCGMEPLIIESSADIEGVILPMLNNQIKMPKPFQDGTPNIVAEIAALF